ncbi:MAG: HNH endonuclease [Geminicoccaceae bacterium]|nr:HNH endonuclease [Geminicoccaceae bacterium]MDW8342411.1 HNH endonuclease [Geminicoccaceae bacterium]
MTADRGRRAQRATGAACEGSNARPLGPCPLCGRPMIAGASVDRHHLVPRSRGGRETVFMHRICHRKLHSLWNERELERSFCDIEAIRAHPEIRKFVAWLANKPPTFWAPTRPARRLR